MAYDHSKPISDALRQTADCPSLDDLISYLEGKRGDAAREQTKAHLNGCSYCQTELAMFREFETPELRPEEQAPVRHIVARLKQHSPIERTGWWQAIWSVKVWAPMALAMVAAGLILTIWTPGQRNVDPSFSGGENTLRSARLEIVGPTGVLRESPREFRWQPLLGAVSYRFRLFEVDNTELWSTVVREPKAVLPAGIGNRLAAPKALNWRVTATSATGITIGDSGTQRFSIIQ